MSKVILAGLVAAALALAGPYGGHALAQTAPAKEATDPTKPAADKDDAKAKKAADRKAKTDARKTKREEAKKERAEKKTKASAARTAVRERQKQCGSEWREARKAGKVEKGMTWPKFWSACNTRLKTKTG
jgi:uncharacterized membrane protein